MLKSYLSQMPLAGWILLALAGIALFGFSMFEIVQKQYKEHPAKAGNYSDGRTNESNQQNAESRAEEQERNSGGFLSLAEKYSGFFLVIVTGILVLMTGFLWLATRDLVRGAEETAERQLRAYVFVSQADIRNVGTAQPLQATVQIVNNGQTPAYQMAGWAVVGPTLGLTSNDVSPTVIGPKVEVYFRPVARRSMTSAEHAQVVQGTLPIYVYGEISYIDAFKKKRFTSFRLIYRGNGIDPGPAAILALDHAKEGNYSN